MGEFNVMIADKAYRRKGYASTAVILAMMWAHRYMKLTEFFVKIDKDNTPSIKMFEKLGFKFYHFNHHFNENEYRLKIDNALAKKWIQDLGLPIRMCFVFSTHTREGTSIIQAINLSITTKLPNKQKQPHTTQPSQHKQPHFVRKQTTKIQTVDLSFSFLFCFFRPINTQSALFPFTFFMILSTLPFLPSSFPRCSPAKSPSAPRWPPSAPRAVGSSPARRSCSTAPSTASRPPCTSPPSAPSPRPPRGRSSARRYA